MSDARQKGEDANADETESVGGGCDPPAFTKNRIQNEKEQQQQQQEPEERVGESGGRGKSSKNKKKTGKKNNNNNKRKKKTQGSQEGVEKGAAKRTGKTKDRSDR